VPAINKERRSQFNNKKSIFNTFDVVFGELFLLLPINKQNTVFFNCVINFVHNLVIGLVIKSEHCFQ